MRLTHNNKEGDDMDEDCHYNTEEDEDDDDNTCTDSDDDDAW